MTFASLSFLALLLVLMPLAWLVRQRLTWRNGLFLVASYAFYAAWDARFLGLIVASTIVDYLAARAIGAGSHRRRAWLGLSLAVNLGILCTFKYLGFFVDSFAELAGAMGWHVHLPSLSLVLPIGISFYTFQTLGYTIDVYRGRVDAEHNPLTFALFVAWFPQLVAGPIERASSLLPQLRVATGATSMQVQRGFFLLVSGLFKKAVLADNLARVADPVFAADSPAAADVWIATLAFAFQIYADFSGYTDMARGVSKMLGVELSHNFDRPYLARTPRAFWQRWHITLGAWFRDYVYIPLGGRSGGSRALILVFVLAGLWHGAAFTFLLWGLYHGAWLVLWRATRFPRAFPHALSVAGTFAGVCFGWLLFRADSFEHVSRLLAASGERILGLSEWWILGSCLGVYALATLMRRGRDEPSWVFELPLPARVIAYGALWFGIILYVISYCPGSISM